MRYRSTVLLTSGLEAVGGQRHASTALPVGKRPGIHLEEVGGLTGRSGRVPSHIVRLVKSRRLQLVTHGTSIRQTMNAYILLRKLLEDPEGTGRLKPKFFLKSLF